MDVCVDIALHCVCMGLDGSGVVGCQAGCGMVK